MRVMRALLCLTFLGILTVAPAAHAQVASVGNFALFQGTNSPDNFFEIDTLTLGTSTTDGGALDVNLSIVPTGPRSEWDIFTFQTVSGAPIASNLDGSWELSWLYLLNYPNATLNHLYTLWGTDGTLISPTSATGSGLSLETNPVTGLGQVLGAAVDDPLPGFVGVDGCLNITCTGTFDSSLSGYGYDPSSINTYQVGLEISAVPEPASLALFGIGLAGLALVRRRMVRHN